VKDIKLECSTEGAAVNKIKLLGGILIKLSPLGYVGIPDRILLGPNSTVLFIEFKRKGKVPTLKQLWWHEKLSVWGFEVFVMYEWQEVVRLAKERFDDGN